MPRNRKRETREVPMALNEVEEQSPGIERERALEGSFSYDSLDVEAASLTTVHPHHSSEERNQDWGMMLRLAFQSLGIVYGDIGTSPLYVYASTFPDGIGHEDDILGVLCLIIYTITMITLLKYKFDQGGYLPLAFTALLITIMLVWNYVYRKTYMYELVHKVSNERVEEIILNPNIHRIPGIAFFYSELVQGIPPIFEHYVRNVPALHSVLIFVSIKSLPISRVPPAERFLFRRVGSHNCFVFRCVARYGYKDTRSEHEPFDEMLVPRLKEFMESARALENDNDEVGGQLELVQREWKNGVVHLLGENEVVAGRRSGLWKKFVINYAYGILRRNIRQQDEIFTIPKGQLLKVQMTVEL